MNAVRRFTLFFVVCSAWCAGFLMTAAAATYTLAIDENVTLRPSDQRVLGFNDEAGFFGAAANGSSTAGRAGYYDAFKKAGVSTPVLRGFFEHVNWKETIGPVDKRCVNEFSQVYTFGLVEWIKETLALTPDAAFSIVVKVEDDPGNLQDLVRFLTLYPDDPNAVGMDGVNWAQKRVDYGLAFPVKLASLELGNETDWYYFWQYTESEPVKSELDGAVTEAEKQQIRDRVYSEIGDMYTDWCRELLPALKAVNPDVPLAVITCTAPHESITKYSIWRQKINSLLMSINEKVDYLVVHLYYHSVGSMYQYFNASNQWAYADYNLYSSGLPTEKKPKMYMSEHAVWGAPELYSTDSRTIATGRMGTLSTADMVNRLIKCVDAPIATYHATASFCLSDTMFGGNVWGVIRGFPSCGYVVSGVGEFFKMASDVFGVNSVKVTGDTMTSTDFSLTASAHTTQEGGLNILVVNATSGEQKLNFSTENNYKLEKTVTLTASGDYMDNGPLTAVTAPDAMAAKSTLVQSDTVPSQTIGAKTITAYYLVPQSKQYTANDAMDIRINDVPADVDSQVLPVIKDDRLRVHFDLYENGALTGANTIFVTVLKPGADIAAPASTDVVYTVQVNDIYRRRGYFETMLPHGLTAGEYTLQMGTSAAQKAVKFNFQPSVAALDIRLTSAPNTEDKVCFDIYWNDQRTQEGNTFVVQATGKADGQVRYIGAGVKTGSVQSCSFLMPHDAMSGEYDLCVTAGGVSYAKTVFFAKQFENMRLMDTLKTADGGMFTLKSLAVENQVTVSLKNIGSEPVNSYVILAVYNQNGRLIGVGQSETVTAQPGGEIHPAINLPPFSQATLVRAFIWERGTIRPLTDAYLVKE